MKALAYLSFALLTACPPPQQLATSIPQDASDAASYGPASASCVAACASLAAAGCSEGNAPNCATRLDLVSRDRLIRISTGEALSCDGLVKYVHTYADTQQLGIACTP